MRPSDKHKAVSWPKLSGPHICVGAGQQALDLARKSLHSAADMRGGKLSKADISAIFDFIATSPDLFDIYRSNYEACGRIHKKQPFVGANKDFFAMSVLRFLCFDILRKAFEPQIKRTDANWEIEFLQAFSAYICATCYAGFIDDLSKAYRKLAKAEGNSITAITIANNKDIQDIVKRASKGFPREHIDYVNFSNAVNKKLSDKYETYGPSPLKVSEPVIELFFEQLHSTENRNYFRQMILG
ncbi:MAG: hypothetical protein K5905_13905 [Roseibium sp.]|uniref:hypothetical protein n=1 Tax=Roseibium sp. TaxID=1936156 RepID=UPI00261A64EC|nr:hypothetical protein [Roseibium sp.]MCV0426558.1 hypothetical protein [Roseibium sp.]